MYVCNWSWMPEEEKGRRRGKGDGNEYLKVCIFWFPTVILKPQKHKNHPFIDKTNKWISAPFFNLFVISSYIMRRCQHFNKSLDPDLFFVLISSKCKVWAVFSKNVNIQKNDMFSNGPLQIWEEEKGEWRETNVGHEEEKVTTTSSWRRRRRTTSSWRRGTQCNEW